MISKFKLFESEEEYKILATNYSSYHWEYDNIDVTAQILLDNYNNLFLKINKMHVKTGIGAGKFPQHLEFKKIGTIQKPDLGVVRNLLSKYSYDQKKFSKFWEDEDRNRMSLSEILKMYKEEQKPQLKHIEPISNFQKEEKDIELVQYSDRSYALFGEGTRKIKEQLKSLGCRFNPFLTDPKTGQKRAGWIFSINKLDKVKELLS